MKAQKPTTQPEHQHDEVSNSFETEFRPAAGPQRPAGFHISRQFVARSILVLVIILLGITYYVGKTHKSTVTTKATSDTVIK